MSTNSSSSQRLRPALRPRVWPPEIRLAVVVAACLIGEAIVAKNALHVRLDLVAQLAPIWVYGASLAWGVRERANEIATIVLAIGSTAGVLVYYAL